MRRFVVSLAGCLVGVLMVAAMEPVPVIVTPTNAFAPLRDALALTDQSIRDMELQDRSEVDKAVGVLAKQVLELQAKFEGSESVYEATKKEMTILRGKASKATDLIRAFELGLNETTLELELTNSTCDLNTQVLEDAMQRQKQRSTIMTKLLEVLDAHMLEKTLSTPQVPPSEEAIQVLNMVQQSMSVADENTPAVTSLTQQDSTTTTAPSTVEIPDIPKSLEDVILILRELQHKSEQADLINAQLTVLEQSCSFSKSKASLRDIGLRNDLWNITREQKEWTTKADDQERQLDAARPTFQTKLRAIEAVRKEITDLANAYQERRNTRHSMLCHTVTARRMVTDDETDLSIQEAVLPGPAQYEQATLRGETECPPDVSPVAPSPSPSAGSSDFDGVKPCVRHPMTPDGPRPPGLADSWADKASDEPCVPLPNRLVDASDPNHPRT